MSTNTDSLAGFSPATRAWFADVFAAPTPAQEGAWAAIASGEHALIIAPTGSGKTLAAFLSALDQLATQPRPEALGARVLYVSPLKALAVDVERNLRAPLRGIAEAAARLGLPSPDVSVAVRSGDTTPTDRRRLVSHPPDILITTPESLFLMLTSQARETLTQVRTVILDEVHALAGTKRGAHLQLSLERLQRLVDASAEPHPVQRVGLSATVRPPERVARFVAGTQPCRIVAPAAPKEWDLRVVVPVEDMGDLGAVRAAEVGDDAPAKVPSIWPHVEAQVLDLIEAHRSTIVFANSRRLAERLTAHLNELHAERLGFTSETGSAPPAQLMAQSGATRGLDAAAPVVARAHHGSVSKEQRAAIEAELKSGLLPCVVATSSLELGIDMGAVDLVVQVESPPSVASGLQRVGRAGHQVGATSRGVFFPKHRGDLVESAVVVERMRAGQIEEVAELANPLDVLAQQLVALCVDETVPVDDAFALVRRASSFATLSRSLFESVLDMLAGRYPSEDFAELRPRLVWDRQEGTISARPGARRLVATSGGTIPDRGLFGVFIVGDDEGTGRRAGGRRVGELDEEMVYESRVGDVFTLGTSTWRIEQITHDQVIVTPAPGAPGRLPFWRGDSPPRPAELGRAFGDFVQRVGAAPREQAERELAERGLDPLAAGNLVTYLAEQQAATRALPTATTVVVERFRDELGDWRVCVHSPLGAGVLDPWALLIERRARDRYGLEVSATATNDGIIVRVPDSDAPPPGADLVVCDPDEVEELITDEVGGSALFASRFRECAARALLLPRRDPRARSPLWQQRMRSAQLLSVAARYPDFPIVLETVRECLTDVFDVPGLVALQRGFANRSAQVVEVETREPSPFAASLLFGYVGEFIYDGDQPLAERRAAALTLDPGLLAELLGRDGLKQLLDPAVMAAVEADLQWRSDERRASSLEQLVDLVRSVGPFTAAEVAQRCTDAVDVPSALAELTRAKRLAEVRIAGAAMVAAADDLPLLRDAIGLPVPPGYPDLDRLSDDDPHAQLAQRWARTHAPFTAATFAARYGLAEGRAAAALQVLVDDGTLVRGSFTEAAAGALEFCHTRVLQLIKRRTLALLRAGVEPVDGVAYARFLARWQDIGGDLSGVEGVFSVVEQLAGVPLPASMIESIILPARVRDYRPALLDELLAAGEITWNGAGAIGGNDGWVQLWPADLAAPAEPAAPTTGAAAALLDRFGAGSAWFFADLTSTLPAAGADEQPLSTADWSAGLWELVWGGHLTCDTFAPVRARTSEGALKTVRPPRSRLRASARRPRVRLQTPSVAGRWALVRRAALDPAARWTNEVLGLLDRYGVVTRGSALTEHPEGGFSPTYRALAQLEDNGQCRRGYFIEGLGASQFALPGAVDALRAQADVPAERRPLVLAACDPANPYGAALPWPATERQRPARKAGALVCLVDGALVAYIERGGKSLVTFTDDGAVLAAALGAFADAVRRGLLGKVTIERADSEHVFGRRDLGQLLLDAGFAMTPQGYRLRSDVR